MSYERLIDISEVSSRLGISIKTIYGWVHMRKIPFIKTGRLVRFDQQDIARWIEQNKVRMPKN